MDNNFATTPLSTKVFLNMSKNIIVQIQQQIECLSADSYY
jgi:hypothetical protein